MGVIQLYVNRKSRFLHINELQGFTNQGRL